MALSFEPKETVNLVPALYDEIRPNYPAQVLRAVEEYAALSSTSRVVEIGPGTGQASDYFMRKGCQFVARSHCIPLFNIT